MSIFNKSISNVFQSSLYYNQGPLKYNRQTSQWGPLSDTNVTGSVPYKNANIAIPLSTAYINTYMSGSASITQEFAVISAINNEIASYPAPNNNVDDATWQGTILTRVNKKLNATFNTLNYYGNSYGFTIPGVKACILDPLAQNFFVDSTIYSNGVFLSSIGLFFASKDPTIPVSLQIISVNNGFPDISKPIAGSVVFKKPIDINVPTGTPTNSIGPITNFYFDYPIYLAPGQYSFIIQSNSNAYTMYASVMGKAQFGTTNTVLSPSYTGVLFKSQNASTWVPATGTGTAAQTVSESLCFVINICNFAGGNANFQLKSQPSGPDPILYDLINLTSNDLTFNLIDKINYSASTIDYSTSLKSSLFNILHNNNTQLPTRQIHQNANDITLNYNLINSDQYTSPMVDLHRVSNILIKNHLSPYDSANTAAESLPGIGIAGGAQSRYISKLVTLQNGFSSTGITVYLDVNRLPGTKIEVYYKVMSQYDNNLFDSNPYVLMSPILVPGNNQLPDTGPEDWTRDTYQALNIKYNDVQNGTLYTDFNRFAIKVCFYSDNPAIAPRIKNFRAIATA